MEEGDASKGHRSQTRKGRSGPGACRYLSEAGLPMRVVG